MLVMEQNQKRHKIQWILESCDGFESVEDIMSILHISALINFCLERLNTVESAWLGSTFNQKLE